MRTRIKAIVSGRVQGVGFRPTVYRYALKYSLSGSVRNAPDGVVIDAEGEASEVTGFLEQLQRKPPASARIDKILIDTMQPRGGRDFVISKSQRSGNLKTDMPPDIATCERCLAELTNPKDRRYHYPFLNCTNCGPRFTIICGLPYDRINTSMATFRMCPSCMTEYKNPLDRRFDAQPNACEKCGPRLALIDAANKPVEGDPVLKTIVLLKQGRIIAVKGLGGYHLCGNAHDANVVTLLRKRKNRPHKPLAVMFESIGEITKHCFVDSAEAYALKSSARPIITLRRKATSKLPLIISPDTADIGAFLPYTPLHYLLLAGISPLVMTSGNLSEEPIVQNEDELQRLLDCIADYALIHNRDIIRRCDDSVLKIVRGHRLFFRRSRGYVPDSIDLLKGGSSASIAACGAELKNTFCITRNREAFLSQHIGDLKDYTTLRFFRESIEDYIGLLKVQPQIVAHDMHPAYLSTRFALESDIEQKIPVQHHHAHIASCMCEHRLSGPVIGVALDGAGLGTDGTVWGGEFLVTDITDFRRVARFEPVPLPGGDQATLHPLRMAYSYVSSCTDIIDDSFTDSLFNRISAQDKKVLLTMIRKNIESPLTSSAGRLFDAVAALCGLCDTISYEAQAAIRLQACAHKNVNGTYRFSIEQAGGIEEISFRPMIKEIITHLKDRRDTGMISAMFHNTVAHAVVETCVKIRHREGIDRVVLSGGVFQNDLLLNLIEKELHTRNFKLYSHSLVPPNDGGISLGQAAVAAARLHKGTI